MENIQRKINKLPGIIRWILLPLVSILSGVVVFALATIASKIFSFLQFNYAYGPENFFQYLVNPFLGTASSVIVATIFAPSHKKFISKLFAVIWAVFAGVLAYANFIAGVWESLLISISYAAGGVYGASKWREFIYEDEDQDINSSQIQPDDFIKKYATLGIVSVIVGIIFGYAIHQVIKPTEEQARINKINKDIKTELCLRLSEDIDKFQDSPNTYKRTSLKTIYNESIITVKATSVDVYKDEIIEYTGKSNLFEDCLEDSKRWVKIPTYFPENFEDEYESIFNSPLIASPQQDKAKLKSIQNSKRLALVIGNSNYKDSPLKNPINDAKDIALTLKDSGFKVMENYDLSSSEMKKTISDFSESVGDYETILLYYSGHGIEFSGRNFFIPVDADIKNEEEIPRQGFDITSIVEKINRQNVNTSIFIIDACRNTPIFSKTRGFQSGLASMQTTNGSVIAYSAAPGKVALDGDGRNSPYTKALLRQIKVPGKKIEDVLKATAREVNKATAGRQTPWYNSSLIEDFIFLKE